MYTQQVNKFLVRERERERERARERVSALSAKLANLIRYRSISHDIISPTFASRFSKETISWLSRSG